MIRIILIVCITLGLSGTVTYMAKLSVEQRFDELQKLHTEIALAEARTATLSAEWAYLSRPDRILNLSSNFLSMRPSTPDRVIELDELPLREGS